MYGVWSNVRGIGTLLSIRMLNDWEMKDDARCCFVLRDEKVIEVLEDTNWWEGTKKEFF